MISQKNLPPWLLVVAIFSLLWLPNLFAIGMFVDGITDALLAENFHLKLSSLWQPRIFIQSISWGTMPVSIFLLSGFYKIFGNHYYVERIYSFCCALVQLGLIYCVWGIAFPVKNEPRKYFWLPCLFWVVCPLMGWCYSNNLLENTMTLFTTSAIILSLWHIKSQKNMVVTSFFVATFILLAFLTKGPVSLFVFALPILFTSVTESFTWRQSGLFTLWQILFFSIAFIVLFSFSAPKEFLSHYLQEQIRPALLNGSTVGYKPYSILLELLIITSPFLLLSIIRFFALKNKLVGDKIYCRFLLLGLCGSIPIMISNKQSQFYLLPAMVPFIIGFAFYLFPFVEWMDQKISERIKQVFGCIIKYGGSAIIAGCIFLCFSKAGSVVRERSLLNDLQQLNALSTNESIIGADVTFREDWYLRAYLLRLYHKRIAFPD